MGARSLVLVLAIGLVSGCSGAGLRPIPGPATESIVPFAASKHYVYWTLFASCSYPQIQFAALPLKASSKAANLPCTGGNGLSYTSALHVDKSGRLWAIFFGTSYGDPGSAAAFKLPLKTTSVPEYTFVLKGTNDPDHLTFDTSGNLWVSSHDHGVAKYKGPFTKSGTLTPALMLTAGISKPAGIAFDKKGNLYVSNFASTGKNSIAVFKAPIAKKPSYDLDGLTQPAALIFDKGGNLYSSINGPSSYAIVRYNSNNLRGGAKPNIVDSAGLSNQPYESDFAFGPTGDLYFANCSKSFSSVYVYPTGTKKFSATLAPSLNYTDTYMQQTGCTWGIAIK